jgi:predicted dehydrogenase
MVTRRARIGVIGTGWWSTYAHLPALVANPEAEVAALAEIRPDVLARAAERYGVSRTYTDYRQMLVRERLDGAVVAVWHAAHFEVAQACLEAGLHLVLEKPMVLRAAHAQRLVALARERQREIILSYPWQYLPLTLRARAVVQSGALGVVRYISCVYSSACLNLYRGNDRSDRPEMAALYPVVGPGDVFADPERSGGGQGHLQVTHAAALLFFITGLHPVSVMALMDNLDVRVDVIDAIIARLDNGALTTIGSTGTLEGENGKLDLQIYCDRGWVDLDYIAGTGRIRHADGTDEYLPPGVDDPRWNYPDFQDYPADAPVTNLVNVIVRQSANGSPAEVGWRTVELLEAAYRSSAVQGQSVAVSSLYGAAEAG